MLRRSWWFAVKLQAPGSSGARYIRQETGELAEIICDGPRYLSPILALRRIPQAPADGAGPHARAKAGRLVLAPSPSKPDFRKKSDQRPMRKKQTHCVTYGKCRLSYSQFGQLVSSIQSLQQVGGVDNPSRSSDNKGEFQNRDATQEQAS